MIPNLLTTLSGFFDRRFVTAYWAPAALCLGLFLPILILHRGLEAILKEWTALAATGQLLLGAIVFIIATVLAYVLEALTVHLMQLYEGYSIPKWLADWGRAHQKRVLDKVMENEALTDERPNQRAQPIKSYARYFTFPRSATLLRPTRLGNILTAAEEYPYQLYNLNGTLWWPRIAATLPEAFRTQIEGALTPLITLINLCTIFSVVGILGGIYLLVADPRPWVFAVPILIGSALAWACYRAAVSQALSYGNLFRVAFDYYRHEILKEMQITIPENLAHEKILWEALNRWLFYFTPPWRGMPDGSPPWLGWPFTYSTAKPAAAEATEPSPTKVQVEGTLNLVEGPGGGDD